jgi:hypothetical protein
MPTTVRRDLARGHAGAKIDRVIRDPLEALDALVGRVTVNREMHRRKPVGYFVQTASPEIRQALSALTSDMTQAQRFGLYGLPIRLCVP